MSLVWQSVSLKAKLSRFHHGRGAGEQDIARRVAPALCRAPAAGIPERKGRVAKCETSAKTLVVS